MLADLQYYAESITKQADSFNGKPKEEIEKFLTPRFLALAHVYRNMNFENEEHAMSYLLDMIADGRKGLKMFHTDECLEMHRYFIIEAAVGIEILMRK